MNIHLEKDFKNIIVVIGATSKGLTILGRVSKGKHILLADLNHENNDSAAKNTK